MKAPRALSAASSLVLLAGLASTTLSAPAQAATYRNVTNVAPGHVAWIHSRPNAASPRVGYLKAGALRVRTTRCQTLIKGGWCQVMRRGTRGWVQDRFLMPDQLMRS